MDRSRLRLAGLLLLLPAFVLATGAIAILPLVIVPVLLLGPALWFGDQEPPPEPADSSDDGGGGGGRPPKRGPSPKAPSGGLPLPDARPGSWRRRGHGDAPARGPRERRPAREPLRSPRRVPV